MNTTQAQQKALDDALVALTDRLEFEKCNMRLKTNIKPKEATFQVATVSVHRSSIRFTINKKKVSLDVDIFRDILQFCLKIPRQVFEDLLPKHNILSFIRDLGHTGDITYLTDVNVDYLHQPWRAFATVINKCLSGKETRMDKIPDSDTSPKKKPVQAAKGTRLKSKAKVAKLDKKKQPVKKTKAKGLAVLSEVALTKAEQIKLATKRSKKDFHVSHASGSGVPDVPLYESKSDKESWGDSEDEDDNDDDGDNDEDGESDDHDQTESEEEDVDDRVRTPSVKGWLDEDLDNYHLKELHCSTQCHTQMSMWITSRGVVLLILLMEYKPPDPLFHRVNRVNTSDYELTDEEKLDDEETMDDQEDDAVIKELYGDVNKADEPVQSSSVSSDFTCKLLNLENPSPADNEIASLMETSARHATAIPEITFGFTTTTHPPTPFLNPLLQQQTPTFATTTSTNPTFKQTNQFAEAVSSISGIVDTYLTSKMKEAVDVAVQLQTNKLREEA
ncbi:hypothetical protein Tco_0795079 [Tanacetum coccineum]